MSKNLVIAIDGPAGSGKSTTAQLVAQKLGFIYIDTGAMYRAITYLAIREDAVGNNDKIVELAANSDIELKFENGVTSISINGEDLTDKIRTLDVNKKYPPFFSFPISRSCAYPVCGSVERYRFKRCP